MQADGVINDNLCLHRCVVQSVMDLNVFEKKSATILGYGNIACSFLLSKTYSSLRNRVIRHILLQKPDVNNCDFTITIFPVNGLKIISNFSYGFVSMEFIKVFPTFETGPCKRLSEDKSENNRNDQFNIDNCDQVCTHAAAAPPLCLPVPPGPPPQRTIHCTEKA